MFKKKKKGYVIRDRGIKFQFTRQNFKGLKIIMIPQDGYTQINNKHW